MNISNIKEIFEALKELIKKGATLEAQKKIIELEEKVILLQKENLALKHKIEVMEKGERCPKCKKPAWNLIDSKPHSIFGVTGVLERTFKCSECGHTEKHQYDSFQSKS